MTPAHHARPRPTAPPTPARPRVERLVSRGVVAAYLHEISTQHPRPRDAAAGARA